MERKLRARNELGVYVSDMGLVCIREDDPHQGEKIIVLETDQVPTIITWLQECLAEAVRMREAGEVEDSEDEPEPV